MKARAELSAAELAELYDTLDRRLSSIGVETQPSVAASILDLTQDPGAGMQDYARIIRNDPGLTGRLIRLSNSAYFAQRKPVTNIDRACVLLGMARIRSISLGFYLSRAAAGEDFKAQLSRDVWGQSVFRACLAAQLARQIAPSLAPEAFVVGLMLDAGVPIVHRLLGAPFESLYLDGQPPTKSFNAEFTNHPYTHVDIIITLVRRWKFPELLAKPIAWHHTPPPRTDAPLEPVQVLYRIAYYAGAVALTPNGRPAQRVPLESMARTHLGIDSPTLSSLVDGSVAEYDAVRELFSDVADPIAHEDLAGRVHAELIGALDAQIEGTLAESAQPGPQEFRLGGLTVMLRPEDEDSGMAFSYDSTGEPLSAYRFCRGDESAESLRCSLGLEPDEQDDLERINDYLRRLAA